MIDNRAVSQGHIISNTAYLILPIDAWGVFMRDEQSMLISKLFHALVNPYNHLSTFHFAMHIFALSSQSGQSTAFALAVSCPLQLLSHL